MGRGLFVGAAWGLAVAVVALVNASLLVPLPSATAPPQERARPGPVAGASDRAVEASVPADSVRAAPMAAADGSVARRVDPAPRVSDASVPATGGDAASAAAQDTARIDAPQDLPAAASRDSAPSGAVQQARHAGDAAFVPGAAIGAQRPAWGVADTPPQMLPPPAADMPARQAVAPARPADPSQPAALSGSSTVMDLPAPAQPSARSVRPDAPQAAPVAQPAQNVRVLPELRPVAGGLMDVARPVPVEPAPRSAPEEETAAGDRQSLPVTSPASAPATAPVAQTRRATQDTGTAPGVPAQASAGSVPLALSDVLQGQATEPDSGDAASAPSQARAAVTPPAPENGDRPQQSAAPAPIVEHAGGSETPAETQPADEVPSPAASPPDPAPKPGVLAVPRISATDTPAPDAAADVTPAPDIADGTAAGHAKQADPGPAPRGAQDVPAPPSRVPGNVPALPAWRQNAAEIMPPAGPVLGVVLIDPGLSAPAREAFVALGLQVSVAVPAGRAEAIAAYRAAGLEVLVLPGPQGMRAALAGAPGAMGVLVGDGAAVPDPGALAARGHALVLAPEGPQGPAGMGGKDLPALRAFHVLDAQRERPIVIGRYLGRAAFEAARTGAEVLLGHAYPDTLIALQRFQTSPDRGGVTLVPVSEVMQRQIGAPGERG